MVMTTAVEIALEAAPEALGIGYRTTTASIRTALFLIIGNSVGSGDVSRVRGWHGSNGSADGRHPELEAIATEGPLLNDPSPSGHGVDPLLAVPLVPRA